MADHEADKVKPWTIKGIPPEIRNAAIAAADREKMSIGTWLGRAILAQVKSDHGTQRVPAVQGQGVGPMVDIADIERLIAATAELSQASGKPPPTSVTRVAYSLLRQRIESFKSPTEPGKSPTANRKSRTLTENGQTETVDGRTFELESLTEDDID